MNTGIQENRRAKPGQGKKWFYGINPAKLAETRAKIEDSGIEARANLQAMHQFTEIYLSHAADLARSGKKDAARNWVRFFENSRVLHILSDAGFDVTALRAELKQVSEGCHPLDVPEWETDIQAIRETLNEILFHVAKQSSPIDETTNPCGCLPRQEGH